MDDKIINSIKKGEVVAIIPARSGSKGVKNKNIRPLCGYPLLAYSITAAKLSPSISRVIVSTDSLEYAEIAKKYGAEVPFLRPADLSGDGARDIEFLEHAIQWMYDNEHSVPEYFVHLRPTTPLRDIEPIEVAVAEFKNDNDATSLRSAHAVLHTPYKWFRKTEDGRHFCSILDGLTNDEINNPRQGFPPVFEPNGYVDVLRTEFVVSSGLMHGDKMIAFETPSRIDIDSVDDIKHIEYLMDKNPHSLVSYLKEHFPLEGDNL